jgi:hypothetical protein
MNPISIYCPDYSSRILYSIDFIFDDILKIPYLIFADTVPSEPFINYSHLQIADSLQIIPHPIMYEHDIHPQDIVIKEWNQLPTFFTTHGSFIEFDIFASSFYLVSRYEEYLCSQKDEYDRFPHTESLAFKHNFLNLPLINLWCAQLLKGLNIFDPSITSPIQDYQRYVTYDIDIAYSYYYKGSQRTIGGLLRDLKNLKLTHVANRLNTLLLNAQDPYDCYDYLEEIHKQTGIHAAFFYLMAENTSAYDKNINPYHKGMYELIRKIDIWADTGIHPSYLTMDNPELFTTEQRILNEIISYETNISRQHYIRWDIGTHSLICESNQIILDFSMGYGSINGYRASTGNTYTHFDLHANEKSKLRIVPFCWMDTNSKIEQKQSVEQTQEELNHYIKMSQQTYTPLITIWHNFSLGNDPQWKHWKELHHQFITTISAP